MTAHQYFYQAAGFGFVSSPVRTLHLPRRLRASVYSLGPVPLLRCGATRRCYLPAVCTTCAKGKRDRTIHFLPFHSSALPCSLLVCGCCYDTLAQFASSLVFLRDCCICHDFLSQHLHATYTRIAVQFSFWVSSLLHPTCVCRYIVGTSMKIELFCSDVNCRFIHRRKQFNISGFSRTTDA